jgi:hypothetical protein
MRRLWVLAAALVLASSASACGPDHARQIGLKSKQLDLLYGRQGPAAESAPLSRPPGAEPDPTTFPSFLAAPVKLSGGGALLSTQDDGPGPDGPPADTSPCPKPSKLAVPKDPADTVVQAPPKAGVYRFRRTGDLRTAPLSDPRGYDAAKDAPAQPLSPEVVREVRNVSVVETPGQPKQFRYDVVEASPGLKTTTTFRIDNTAGIYIERIVTERTDLPAGPAGSTAPGTGVESFNPQPAIKIVNLPMAVDPIAGGALAPAQRGQGVDPLTGVFMQVDIQNKGRVTVPACGEVAAGWLVSITAGNFNRPNVRDFQIAGSFTVATGLGGLVIADDVYLFQGRDYPENIVFEQRSAATVNHVAPS